MEFENVLHNSQNYFVHLEQRFFWKEGEGETQNWAREIPRGVTMSRPYATGYPHDPF